MIEEWKNYIYNYDISNLGRLRNNKTRQILSWSINKKGYLSHSITLGQRGKYKTIRAHRAVAESFIPNPDNLPEVNHIDGDKTNNKISNLEWCTGKQNIQHAYKNGLKTPLKAKNRKISNEDIQWIKEHYIPGSRVYGSRALGRKFGVDHGTILDIMENNTYVL